jgi:hypothetical protein
MLPTTKTTSSKKRGSFCQITQKNHSLKKSIHKRKRGMPNLCLCLCVFENERGLPFVLKNIDVLRESGVFENIQVLAFYDFSKDASLTLLKNYQSKHPSTVIRENPTPLNNIRVERIAHARNQLLQMIRDDFETTEYFAMMDSNHYSCVGKIRPPVLLNVLRRADEWDAVSFDRADGYYDLWALSYDPYLYSFYHFTNWEKSVHRMRTDFEKRKQKFKPNDLYRVYSAFNGFSLYKTAVFLDEHYSCIIDPAVFPNGTVKRQCGLLGLKPLARFDGDCEHRRFHLDAVRKKNARVCISFLHLFESTRNNI